MGTNFYWNKKDPKYRDDIHHHIGKRSAAGLYCWDCGTTFCVRWGTRDVHFTSPEGNQWSDVCPSCGKSPEKKSYNAACVELGFTKPATTKPEGVSSCSSFTWSLMKHYWDLKKMRGTKKKVVKNEYGDKFTADEFLDMVECCPIWEQNPTEFS